MAFSVEATVKNTFISFKLEPEINDAEVPSSLRGSPKNHPRSRSAEVHRFKPEANELEELPQQSLQNLTAVLSSGVLQPSSRNGSRVSSPSPTQGLVSPKPRGLGLHLKNRKFDQHRRVDSSCSLSTMAPDEASEPMITSQLKCVGSSNSISSMVSWADITDEEEQEDVEFEMEIEENPGPSVSPAAPAAECVRVATPEPEPVRHGARFQPSYPPVPKFPAVHRPAVEHNIGKVTSEMSHSLVPKTQDMARMYNITKDQPPTTLMIRNIPGKYTQTDLMNDLADAGFGMSYDFLYLPIDKVTSNNVGYAFVNFVHPCIAANCMQNFEGYHFAQISKSTRKRARISVAHLQGLEKNLAHYEKTAVNVAPEKQRRPVVIANISTMFGQPPGVWA